MTAIVIPIPIYPIVLLVFVVIGGIVNLFKRGQAAAATIDAHTFRSELTTINRKITPAIERPVDTIATAATGIANVRVEQCNPTTVFLSLQVVGGLWARIIASDRGDHTLLTIEAARKVAGLATLTQADDALILFEKALRQQLAGGGRQFETSSIRADAGQRALSAAPAPAPAAPAGAAPALAAPSAALAPPVAPAPPTFSAPAPAAFAAPSFTAPVPAAAPAPAPAALAAPSPQQGTVPAAPASSPLPLQPSSDDQWW